MSSLLELKLHSTLDKLSNNEAVHVEEEWIEEAGEMFKEGLRKQLFRSEGDDSFRLRMSNLGKPLCQLQMQKAGAEPSRMPYNHIVRMMTGDAVEAFMEVLIKAAKWNVTGGKSKVSMDINGTTIKGENDIEIDNKVYDTKTCSPWAFTHKWLGGVDALKKDDAFGYIPQLVGYAKAGEIGIGGWIVVNKSSGEVTVVEANEDTLNAKEVEEQIVNTVDLITSDAPFKRCYEPEKEYFRKQPTGNLRLGTDCSFCSFKSACWPDAVYRPQGGSKAANPKHFWYAHYEEPTDEESL
tara:strand:+ start:4095 stop:4979 length:885 start_codon:yes stop_codon:yes gene_type:complete